MRVFMDIRTSEENNKIITKVTGEIDIYNSASLRKAVSDFINQNKINILLNMDDVDFIDSSCVGVLIASATDINELGGDFSIKCDSPDVMRVFELTGLDNFFKLV